MNWSEDQLQEIRYGKTRKLSNRQAHTRIMKTVKVPIPYVRLVHQFCLEEEHSKTDLGHESLRCMTYAQAMLDEFGKELDSYKGEESKFRSKVFTPVLQRQLKGVPDAYAPAIRRAIAPRNATPTISQVTTFYLGNDPLDPKCIPVYRRNILYSRPVMWHLTVLMGKVSVSDTDAFNDSLECEDLIMEGLRETPRSSGRGIPLLNVVEVAAIFGAELDEFFDDELRRMVCIYSPSIVKTIDHPFPQPPDVVAAIWDNRGGQGQDLLSPPSQSPNHRVRASYTMPVPGRPSGEDKQLDDEQPNNKQPNNEQPNNNGKDDA